MACSRANHLVLPHPDFVSAPLKMDFVHELADQVNAASVIGLQVVAPLWIGYLIRTEPRSRGRSR
jgi:hypothetical protein